MSKPFLGVGLGFPVTLESTKFLARAEYEQSVRQSIWILLGTAKGERVMRPDFGCGIHDMVFENMSASLLSRVSHEVRETLLRFETRVDVINVSVKPDGDGNVLLIDLDYEVRASNTAFNLVYPFYLQNGAGA